MIAWLAVLKRLWPVFVLLAIGLFVGWYGHTRYKAGEAIGKAKIKKLWDAETVLQKIAVANQAADVAKQIEHDRLAAEEVERGLRVSIANSDADARDLARRLRDAQARSRGCSGLPATPANPGQPQGAGGITGSDGETPAAARQRAIDDANSDVYSACARDAARLNAVNRWFDSVAR